MTQMTSVMVALNHHHCCGVLFIWDYVYILTGLVDAVVTATAAIKPEEDGKGFVNTTFCQHQ